MPPKKKIKVLGGQTRLSDIFQRAGEENLFGNTNISIFCILLYHGKNDLGNCDSLIYFNGLLLHSIKNNFFDEQKIAFIVLVLTQEHYNMVVIGKAEDSREYV